MIELKGIAWDHPGGYETLTATSKEFQFGDTPQKIDKPEPWRIQHAEEILKCYWGNSDDAIKTFLYKTQ